MKPFLSVILIAFCFNSCASLLAVDIFSSEKLKEGELPLSQQESLYKEFFGEQDEAANSSSKRIELALELKKQAEDPRYAPLRRYMLRRMRALCEGSKKREAYEVRLYVLNEEHKGEEPSHQLNTKTIELLELLLKKSGRDEALVIAKEIAALHNANAKFSLSEKKYQRAQEDYKALSSWLKKCRDKEGVQLAKDVIDSIDDYLDEKEDFEEALEDLNDKPEDTKLLSTVGRFYIIEGDWASAHAFLKKAGQNQLADIAAVAQQEGTDLNKQGASAVALGKVLSERSIKRDEPLYRHLLELGMRYKQHLDKRVEDLGPAMKIKYTLVSESWAKELEELGPDPLAGFEVGDASASVDETRLLRMGWIPLFDHKTVGVENTPNDIADGNGFEVKDGIIILKKTGAGQGAELDNFPEIELAKSLKIRFKFVSERSYGWITLNSKKTWSKEVARICVRDQKVGFSRTYGSEGGSINLKPDEWNDLTLSWDGKEAHASLNGEDYSQALPFPYPQVWGASIAVGGISDDIEMHIQSILILKK